MSATTRPSRSKATVTVLRFREGETLVTDGIYARVRHPQYLGIFFLMFGLLLQ